MVRAYHTLTDKLKDEINLLVQKCNEFDGTNRSLYLENDISINPYMNCFFLYFVDEYVVSVLTATQIDNKKIELRGYTLPEERNKGYFLEVLDYAEEEFLVYGIDSYQFVVDPMSKNAQHFMERVGATKVYSSYLLKLDLKSDYKPGIEYNQDEIKFVKLDENNLAEAINISKASLADDSDFTEELLYGVISSETQEGYVLVCKDEIIGVGCTAYGKVGASIFGICIKESHRGKTFGKILLQFLLQIIASNDKSKVILEVSSDKDIAYKMYLNEGFVIIDQNDYYNCNIEVLDDFDTFLVDEE